MESLTIRWVESGTVSAYVSVCVRLCVYVCEKVATCMHRCCNVDWKKYVVSEHVQFFDHTGLMMNTLCVQKPNAKKNADKHNKYPHSTLFSLSHQLTLNDCNPTMLHYL